MDISSTGKPFCMYNSFIDVIIMRDFFFTNGVYKKGKTKEMLLTDPNRLSWVPDGLACPTRSQVLPGQHGLGTLCPLRIRSLYCGKACTKLTSIHPSIAARSMLSLGDLRVD